MGKMLLGAACVVVGVLLAGHANQHGVAVPRVQVRLGWGPPGARPAVSQGHAPAAPQAQEAPERVKWIEELAGRINGLARHSHETSDALARPALEAFERHRLWPVQADAESCTDGAGKAWRTTGPGSSNWLGYGGAGSTRAFSVRPGALLLIESAGDMCPGTGAVIGDLSYRIWEQSDGVRRLGRAVQGPSGFCGRRWTLYRPESSRIWIEGTALYFGVWEVR